MTSFRTLCFPLLLALLELVRGAQDSSPIQVFVDHAKEPALGRQITVPHDTTALRFFVEPTSPRVQYKLDGLDVDWRQRTDEMLFIIRFLNSKGDQVSQRTFSAKGQSDGWQGSVEKSRFTPRLESVTVPADAAKFSVVMSSAGPASLVGIFAISGVTITSAGNGDKPPAIYLKDGRIPGSNAPLWSKSGTHPSMASAIHLEENSTESPVLVIMDDDVSAHADWVTDINALAAVIPGQTLEVGWNETYCTGLGGSFSEVYERLPPGAYRFMVQGLNIAGEPVDAMSVVSVEVPLPYWKNLWFWTGCAAVTAALSALYGRHLIRKRITRHLRHAQLIADERLRIARDLHDDLGTRLSHIALLGAYAESNNPDGDARETFGQITTMSRELISALSETVWMLNPKNNQLEALVDFLCRLVSELCRLSEIRCRIDAMSVTRDVTISHEFRHNVSLAVKEIVNNALKHSFATEIKMSIQLENTHLKITITDNGVGITREPNKTGLGLENIQQRMASIRGKCTIDQHEKEGLQITLEAPIA